MFYSASGGVGYYNPLAKEVPGGLMLDLGISAILSDEIFSLNFSKRISEQIIREEDYLGLDITYGRALELGQKWLLEGHFGLGYIRQKLGFLAFETESVDNVDHAIGLPLRAKFVYRISNSVGFGANPYLNFNGLETFYAINLIFQYNF
ncbi:hypothetical protein [Flagellimonas myxillae]|uniref:hypothetical protein n=1 Tax=Flagellimonas myxillae TaxID=2942214 RepID=UPI00201EE329|nr:hypothetical protein [Muricauda myxillae]MCL6266928.1 hypothetical protein [Muricauda myxillae]